MNLEKLKGLKSTNAVVANAIAHVCNKMTREEAARHAAEVRWGKASAGAGGETGGNEIGDNPNYKSEAGMAFLAKHPTMVKPEVAKAMVDKARREGVKVPKSVEQIVGKASTMHGRGRFRIGDDLGGCDS